MHHRHGRMLKELVAWSEKNNARAVKGRFDPQLDSRTCRRRVEGNVSNEFGVASEQRDSKRMERPMKEIFTAIAFAVLLTAVPALAADTSTNNKPASSISSGPGVKGAPGNKNGPAAQPNSMDKAGSSSGTAYTQPSQEYNESAAVEIELTQKTYLVWC